MMMIKNKTAILLAAALLAGISPAAAQSALAASAEGGSAAIAAAGQASAADPVNDGKITAASYNELRLKIGSRRITVNGVSDNILRAPYTSNGTTLVPLGVFANAFGAESQLGDGNVVKLVLGGRKVTMTIGSSVLWTNKGKSQMKAAPAMAGGVLMVPLRPVAEGLGASVTGSNGEMVVRLPKALSGNPGGAAGTEDEAGTAKVGNSYYGWSINDPGDLVKQASLDESTAGFTDPEGSYYLQVQVVENQPEQDQDSLLDNLAEDAKANQETILHEEVVEGSGNASTYARIITSDEDGLLSEMRAYYANHKIYVIYFSLADALYYEDFDSYAPLLNSFRTSFDAANPHLEDLSHKTEGDQTLYSDVYGIELSAPEGWMEEDNGTDFSGPDGSRIHFNVSSNPAGSSLADWTEQMKQRLAKLYVPSALRILSVSETEVSEGKAAVLKAQVNSGDGWKPLNEVLVVEGGYRYLMEYQGPVQASGVDSSSSFDEILASVDIPFEDIEDFFGKLEDRAQETDLTKTVLKSSSAGGFSIQIPRYWTPEFDQFNPSYVQYSFPGGSFKLAMGQTDDPELYLGELASAYAAAASSGSGITVTTEKTVISGAPATIFTIHTTQDGISSTKRVAAFSRKGTFYQMTFTLNDSNATDEQKAAISRVEKSFGFLK